MDLSVLPASVEYFEENKANLSRDHSSEACLDAIRDLEAFIAEVTGIEDTELLESLVAELKTEFYSI